MSDGSSSGVWSEIEQMVDKIVAENLNQMTALPSSPDIKRACKNCCFSAVRRVTTADRLLNWYVCVRWPPIPDSSRKCSEAGVVLSALVRVSPNNWCGEWQPNAGQNTTKDQFD